MTKVLAIAANELRRMFRQRSNIFFVFLFPMMLILVLGVTFGGAFTPRIGIVVDQRDRLALDLVRALGATPRLEIVRARDEADLLTQVERGRFEAGLVIGGGYDTAIRTGKDVQLRYFARPDQLAQQLGETVRGVVATQSTLLQAARFAVAEKAALNLDAGLSSARALAPLVPRIEVNVTKAGVSRFGQTNGRFDRSASTQLLLFLFLTAMTGSVALIEARQLGVTRRMLATPTSARTLIFGQAAGRFAVAAVQGLVIIAGSALFVGVRWGQPAGVAAVLLLFALVASGAGLLLGTIARTEQQAIAVGLLFGMGFGALGGSMVPLEVFSAVMKRVAHATPHAWGNDAFSKLIAHGQGIGQILPQLGVLALFAVALLTLSSWRLRRALTA